MLIEYTRPNIYNVVGHKFVPGLNDVPDNVWKQAEQVESVKNRIKLGHFVVKDKKSGDDPLKGKHLKVCRDLIAECFELATLERWKSLDRRARVRSSIDDQIKEIQTIEKKQGN